MIAQDVAHVVFMGIGLNPTKLTFRNIIDIENLQKLQLKQSLIDIKKYNR